MAVPEENSSIGDTGVGTAAEEVESDALGALEFIPKPNLGLLEQIMDVFLDRK